MAERISSDDEKKVYSSHDVKNYDFEVVPIHDQEEPIEFAEKAELR